MYWHAAVAAVETGIAAFEAMLSLPALEGLRLQTSTSTMPYKGLTRRDVGLPFSLIRFAPSCLSFVGGEPHRSLVPARLGF